MTAPVNLISDTQTRPTEGMRRAIAAAQVGDEQKRDDPTTLALQERVAALLGHEAALFLPSGTMCNLIGFRLHVRRGGDEVLLAPGTHPIVAEAGGPAAINGALLTVLPGARGMFTGDAVRDAVRTPEDRYAPRTRMVAVEQTTNLHGGRVWALDAVDDVLAAACEHGLRAHLDGARLLNAVAATGVPADRWASGFDTAWIDFSKGLGAPVGACLAGSAELIAEAWRYKQMFGGALRQAGIVTAAAAYALDHHVERLAEDHAHARELARGLAQLPGIELDPATVETNIVVFHVDDAPSFVTALREHGVLMGALDGRRVRAVTHLDVARQDVETALSAAARVAAG